MKIVKSGLLFTFVFCVSSACLDDPNCLNLNNNLVSLVFKSVADGTGLSLDSLVVTAEGATEEILPLSKATTVVVPLNFLNDTTWLTFTLPDTTYKLALSYRSQPQYVSEACGERFVLSDLDVAAHSFDSVRLLSRQPAEKISTSNHIEIYFE